MANDMMVKELDEVVVRFSGDSGDGMQLAGNIFSTVCPARLADGSIGLPGAHRRPQGVYAGRQVRPAGGHERRCPEDTV